MKTIPLCKLFLGCTFILFSTYIYAQRIEGIVYTRADSVPLPYSNVMVYALPDMVFLAGCVTDSTGVFRMDLPAKKVPCLLKVTHIGYQEYGMTLENTDSSLQIGLEEDAHQLDNITVRASRKIYKLSTGGIEVNVSKSPLAGETSPLDVLRKIPGMMLNRGELEAFGLGKPIIYINGKKVMDMSEVERLTVKEIRSVRLITNPGPEYDASGKAVLLITVANPQEGWKLQLDTEEELGNRFSNRQGLHWEYQKGKWNLYGTYQYDNQQTEYDNIDQTGIRTDTVWQYNTVERSGEKKHLHTYQLGSRYALSDNHAINLQYDGFDSRSYATTDNENHIYAEGDPYSLLQTSAHLKGEDRLHHLSAFYSGNTSSKLSLHLYADYIDKRSSQDQQIAESSDEKSSQISTQSKSDFHIYALNAGLTYLIREGHQLSGGGDVHYMQNENGLSAHNAPFADASSSHEENKQALYLSYSYGSEQLNLSLGLRYEHLMSRIRDRMASENNWVHHYHNLFPSVNASYTHNEFSHVLAYGVRTTRPDYDVLNTNIYYTNRFNYRTGNPNIRPSIWHNFSYSLMYKFLYFNLIYANMKNYIGYTYYAAPENPNVIVTSYANYDRFSQLAAVLNAQYQVDFWQPSVMFYFMKPFFEVDYMGQKVKNNRPIMNIFLNQSFDLPWRLNANVEYQYSSSCNYLMFKLRPTHQLNLNLQRTFMDDRLQVVLKVNDLFKGSDNRYTGRINTITFNHNERADNRRWGIHLIYRFNNYKQKATKSGVEEELQRLK